MSRYRPPRPRSSPYITPTGYARLQTELTYLWKEKRPQLTAKVAEAAALGDRSENAEYIYGKRALREIDSRIQFLSRRLDELSVVTNTPENTDQGYFGAWVSIEDEEGLRHTYRIVGADELDVDPAYISIDAPLARALIGRRVGDEISLDQPLQTDPPRILDPQATRITFRYVITDIRYEK